MRGSATNPGRFGSSLAVLPDLNGDGFNDLAVGAPLENNGQGSIYIFHGEGRGRISQPYSQVSKKFLPVNQDVFLLPSVGCFIKKAELD